MSTAFGLTRENLALHNAQEKRRWFQFGCKTCRGTGKSLWWRYLPTSRPSSRCRGCRKAYLAVPDHAVIGYCKLECEMCHNQWGNHRCMYKYRQPCRRCGQMADVPFGEIRPRIVRVPDPESRRQRPRTGEQHECECCLQGGAECKMAPASVEGGDGSVTVLSPGHVPGEQIRRVDIDEVELLEKPPFLVPSAIAELEDD